MASKSSNDSHDPTHVLNQAINQFEAGQDFIPASIFQGARPGYYFTTGSHGVGYYSDQKKQMHSSQRASMMPPPLSRPKKALNAEDLLKEAEDNVAGFSQITAVDAKALKNMLKKLETKYNHNIEQRAKFPDQPSKFLESEIELDNAVRSFTTIATSPDMYSDLVNSGAVPIFVSLIHHENGDIAADTIELLSELTDADAVENSEHHALLLIDALLSNSLLDVIVQRLHSLDETIPEEATAVYNALSVLENCIDLKSDIATEAATRPGLLEWLLQRLKPRAEVDANKQYAAEVLAVVLQSGGEQARQRFIDLGGVDRTLQSVAPYRSRDTTTSEEAEFIENAFDILCAVLMEKKARVSFVEAEGVELMILILKGKTSARGGALKCLDFATTRCPSACEKVVESGGLGVVFSAFMGKHKKRKDKGKIKDKSALKAEEQEEEERAVSIVNNLMVNISADKGKMRERVASKFVENGSEKCDRLMEIYFKYEKRVVAETLRKEEEEEEEDDGDDEMLSNLEAGLFTLQQCAVIAAELWSFGDKALRKRILALLHQQQHTLSMLRAVLLEHRAMVSRSEDEGDEEEKKEQKERVDHLTDLLKGLGYVEESGDGDENKEKSVVGIKRQREDVEEENGGV